MKAAKKHAADATLMIAPAMKSLQCQPPLCHHVSAAVGARLKSMINWGCKHKCDDQAGGFAYLPAVRRGIQRGTLPR